MSPAATAWTRTRAGHDALGAFALFWAWAPMVGALALFGWRPGVLTFLIAYVVVAGRQHSLDILAHEAWHFTLFRRKWVNTLAGRWFCAFPTLSRFVALRNKHFEHHRKVGTLADPDRYYWGWRLDERNDFVRHHLFILSGLWFARHLLGRALGQEAAPVARDPEARPLVVAVPLCPEDRGELVGIAVWHLAALAAFAVTIGWIWYFLLWLFPVLTLRVFINDLRQFLEHRNGRLLVYNTGPVERFFFGPFNFNVHAYHHAFPQEPWYVLPGIGEAARRKCPDIVDYGGYVAELVAYLRGRDRYGAVAELPTAARGDASELPDVSG